MTDKARFPIFATRQNLRVTNGRLKTVDKGHSLLKSKRDMLQIHFRKIEEKYNSLNDNLKFLFNKAYLSLNKAEFLGANVDYLVKEAEKTPVNLECEVLMVSGIQISNFTLNSNNEVSEMHGLGSFQLNQTSKLFRDLVKKLIEINSVNNSYNILKQTLDNTNRRVNSLEFSFIPKLKNTLSFINEELDEQEREDFFRLRKIQGLISKK
ncbi:VATD1 [Hepatospora eriocheir]|uniref:VATD1 n=1 Tax=Hepatospora eriocheir TaxID=1081669 RepID=A0A1X0QK39_9MICR|nr:VATD1 [Hepatospora eriocheir]